METKRKGKDMGAPRYGEESFSVDKRESTARGRAGWESPEWPWLSWDMWGDGEEKREKRKTRSSSQKLRGTKKAR